MKNIENAAQLRMEVARLKLLQAEQEMKIKNDIANIKESLKPLTIAKHFISDMLSKHGKDNDIVTKGAGLGASILAKDVILKDSSPIVKKVVSFFLENLTTNIVADHENAIIDKIRVFLKLLGSTAKEVGDAITHTKVPDLSGGHRSKP